MIDYGDFTLKFDTEGIAGLYAWIDDNFKCIEKGIAPHPYADVLHAWIEDMSKKLQQASDTNQWIVTHNINLDRVKFNQYRIKPSEPVYEYKILLSQMTGDYILSDWMTIDEFNSSTLNGHILYGTKRERK